MLTSVQWTYAQREPISWLMGLLMGFVVLWNLAAWEVQPAPRPLAEMSAYLDIPPVKTSPPPPIVSAPVLVRPAVMAPSNQSTPAPVVASQLQTAAPAEISTGIHDSRPAAVAVATPAVTVAVPPPTTEPARSVLSANYESQLLAYLERIKRYPTSREARLSQPQGVVTLWLEISRSGSLLAVSVFKSSGSNILDSEALRTVRTAQFPLFPENAFPQETSHRFSVSLKYQIEGQ